LAHISEAWKIRIVGIIIILAIFIPLYWYVVVSLNPVSLRLFAFLGIMIASYALAYYVIILSKRKETSSLRKEPIQNPS